MSDDAYTGFTVSFKPGGTGYDSPMLVVRGNTEEELLIRLDAAPDDDLGTAVGAFHAKLRDQFNAVVGTAPAVAAAPAAAGGDVPIWASVPPAATGGLTPNPDGTYPPCVHGTRPRKPWRSPRSGKDMLFCAKDKGEPGACPTITL